MQSTTYTVALILIAGLTPGTVQAKSKAQRTCMLEVPAGAMRVAISYYKDGSHFNSFGFSIPLSGPGASFAQVRSNMSPWPIFGSKLGQPTLHVPVTATPSSRHMLRLSGDGGWRDYAIGRERGSKFAKIPLLEFDLVIDGGDHAAVTLVAIGADGVETIVQSQNIDVAEYRRRLETAALLRTALTGPHRVVRVIC